MNRLKSLGIVSSGTSSLPREAFIAISQPLTTLRIMSLRSSAMVSLALDESFGWSGGSRTPFQLGTFPTPLFYTSQLITDSNFTIRAARLIAV